MRGRSPPARRKEKECEFMAHVTAGKLYARRCVPYLAQETATFFDDIQFTVMAAAALMTSMI